MKGDFSRLTFTEGNHYNGVLMQQGRLQLDADWNEQQTIHRHRVETQAKDVVGPNGSPRTAPGFGITPQGGNLRIGAGRYYVDGILCENQSAVLFTEQPDLGSLNQNPLPAQDGLYLTYLEVWDRHVTTLEDERIRETGLGGPDTATRTKTVWQVRLLRIGSDPGGAVPCDTSFTEFDQLLRQNLIGIANVGRLSARSQPAEATPDPLCILPPDAGYRGLENQLYRVEVHRGGDRTQAGFKWSRDNGTVASAIEPDQGGVVVSGSEISVTDMGNDGMLTFASDPLPEWLELTDDRFELSNQRGTLARVQAVDPATRRITFVPGPLPALLATEHPIVRRWDQRGAGASDQGVLMTGDWQELEGGVQVRFEDGIYRAGDYWVIPARTVIGLETGSVEWPHDGANPVPQRPYGTQHHFAPLALVRRSAGNFTAVPGADCRTVFPPLTAITADDVAFSDTTCELGADTVQGALDVLCQRHGSLCTVLVGPGDDLQRAFQTVNSLPGAADALICVQAGTYTLSRPARMEHRGHIQLTGAGPGTRIIAPSSEAALFFQGCASVKVSNLHVEAGAVGHAGAQSELKGALTFVSCPSVTVEGVSSRCAGGPMRAATCITVRHPSPVFGTQARISSCDLDVGHHQTGVLLVNVDRSVVSGNSIGAGARPPEAVLLADADYRGAVRRQLLSRIVAATAAGPPAGTNATVTFNGHTVHFRSDSRLIRGSRNDNEWQRAINQLNPAGVVNPSRLQQFLQRLASDLIAARGAGAAGSQAFRNLIAEVLNQDTAAAEQAVVVGGEIASEVRVIANSIRDAIQGVHIGLGVAHVDVSAGVVLIEDNSIRVSLPTSATRDRHGIFVGSVNSLVIERNHVSVVRAKRNASLRAEAMRMFGVMGRRVIVRHNHVTPQFAVGVTFAPLNQPLPALPMWIITENVMESATEKVGVPAKGAGQPGVVDPALVRARVRGINDNFA